MVVVMKRSDFIICKFIPAFFIISMIVILSIYFAPAFKVKAERGQDTVYQYTISSVEIQPNESLWSIANKYYSDEFGSVNEYITEIKRINHLKSDVIYAGCYLAVPHYVEVPDTANSL